jgi:hypothetical protein
MSARANDLTLEPWPTTRECEVAARLRAAVLEPEDERGHPYEEMGLDEALASAAIDEDEARSEANRRARDLATELAQRFRAGTSVAELAVEFSLNTSKVIELLEAVHPTRDRSLDPGASGRLQDQPDDDDQRLVRDGWLELARRERRTYGRPPATTVLRLARRHTQRTRVHRPRRADSVVRRRGARTRRPTCSRVGTRGSPSGRPSRDGDPSRPPRVAAYGRVVASTNRSLTAYAEAHA